ncbi:TIGR02679 family protein [Myceligenerans crystallogenes]|uniref:TIGR02679 family protein n=1 Tax=Myceligenerans crystallogenes TaxID=316335 RepID=A0ABP4ZRD0_9MICO
MTDVGWADSLHPLLRECHRRLSTGKPVKSVRLGPIDRAQQGAIADLLGLVSLPTAGARIRLDDVAAAVERLTRRSFTESLSALYGSIGDQAADRERAAGARVALWAWLRDHPVVNSLGLEPWAREVEASGVRGSIDTMRASLEAALLVLNALPSPGEPLPVLAGRTLNDTHALDPGTAVSSFVLGALAVRGGYPRPQRNADRRALWRSVGVFDDVLSSTVLVAGLPAIGDTPSDRTCQLGHADGRAVVLTLADLHDGAPTLAQPTTVWIVENPAVISLAIADLGPTVPPMVCTAGWPSSAALLLLTGLARAGNVLRYHGDLDGEGIRIAAHVIDATGATPWRMSVRDYRCHVASRGARVGRVTPAPWDPDLASALSEHDVAVLEETVWHALRADLMAAPAE